MTKFIVEELVAHRWYAVRTFTNRSDADAFAAWLGLKARVREVQG